MLCTISGEAPTEPVASKKSGKIFEKRLIETYIAQHGREPGTQEELSKDDLLALNVDRSVRPRPPTMTSIPALMSIFQDEWDTIVLEKHVLQEAVTALRQENSSMLYQKHAAERVVARLLQERDEAHDALSKLTVAQRKHAAHDATAATNGDAMVLDHAPPAASASSAPSVPSVSAVPSSISLPTPIASKIDDYNARLSKSRRQRTISPGYATPEAIRVYSARSEIKLLAPNSHALSMDKTGSLALLGGSDGTCGFYSFPKNEMIRNFDGGKGPINDIVPLAGESSLRCAVACSSNELKIFDGDTLLASSDTLIGHPASLAVHPSGDLVVCIHGEHLLLYDLYERKILYDISTGTVLYCCEMLPDGQLVAVGGEDGQIKIYDLKAATQVATFDAGGAVKALAFAENGYWLSSVAQGSSIVNTWDLRKSILAKTVDFEMEIASLRWDETAQYLAVVGSSGLKVQHYDKSNKSWTMILSCSNRGKTLAVAWAPRGRGVVTLKADGCLCIIR